MNSVRPSDQQLPRAGDVVAGKYRVDSVIGTGGMGVVLGAEDTSLGRKVAIKFLAPHKADRDGATARFVREARSAASIQSENCVRVFEVGTLPNGASYIVMEHLAGADLAQTLAARGRLSIEEAVDYLLQACEAIGEAHGRGIVHRDLKPQNLFLTQRPDGSACVKVLDFGISKAIDEEAPNLTSTDMVMGTPLYMSPEQVRSLKSVDHRADIWALGAILFELLTASPIYEAATATALCAMIAMDPPTALRVRRPEAPPELEAIIFRCLHKDPRGRFPDVAALAEALAAFASERGRESAARTSRVVRAGAQQGGFAGAAVAAAGPSPFGTTAEVASSVHAPYMAGGGLPATAGVGGAFPPGMMPGSAVPSYAPPSPSGASLSYAPPPRQYGPPTTQQNWQKPAHATRGDANGPRRSSSAAVALLGGMTGVVVLGLLGGGGYLLYSKKSSDDVASAQASASAAAAAAALPPVTTTAPGTGSVATPTVAAATPVKKGADAGAVALAGQKDAGAVVAAKPKVDEDLEGQKRIAQGQCSHMQFLLRSNDPKNNDQAKQVKLLTCLHASGPQGTTCERGVCRSACSMLQDQSCLFQLDNGERNFPPKF